MESMPVLWTTVKDSLRPELQFRGISKDKRAESFMLKTAVDFIELANKFEGKEQEGFSIEKMEEIFKDAPMLFIHSIIFSNPTVIIYFGLKFASFEKRDQFLEQNNKSIL